MPPWLGPLDSISSNPVGVPSAAKLTRTTTSELSASVEEAPRFHFREIAEAMLPISPPVSGGPCGRFCPPEVAGCSAGVSTGVSTASPRRAAMASSVAWSSTGCTFSSAEAVGAGSGSGAGAGREGLARGRSEVAMPVSAVCVSFASVRVTSPVSRGAVASVGSCGITWSAATSSLTAGSGVSETGASVSGCTGSGAIMSAASGRGWISVDSVSISCSVSACARSLACGWGVGSGSGTGSGAGAGSGCGVGSGACAGSGVGSGRAAGRVAGTSAAGSSAGLGVEAACSASNSALVRVETVITSGSGGAEAGNSQSPTSTQRMTPRCPAADTTVPVSKRFSIRFSRHRYPCWTQARTRTLAPRRR